MSIGIRVRGRRSRFLAILLAVVIAFPITVSGGAAAAQGPSGVPRTLDGLTIEKALRPDRLESSLAQLASVRAEKGASAAKDFGEMRSLDIAADTVEVIVTAQRGQAKGVETRLESIGAKSTGSYEDLVRADVPIEKLEWLSGQPEVLFVRPPQEPTVYPITGAAVANLGEADVTLTAPERVATPSAPAAIVSPAATVILDDGFESWPGPWTAYGSPTWGQTSYDYSAGTYSAYCAQSTIPAPGPYANSMDAWLVAGPFDFDTVSEAVLTFDYLTDFEDIYDTLFVGFSSDASNFTGAYAPAYSSGWQTVQLDMPEAIANQPNVWVAFVFQSDTSVTYEGAYIDEVALSTGTSSTLYTSEGVAETNADVVQAGGIDGAGIKVGIIDGGFAGYTAKLGTELPASVTCWGGSDLGPEGNGTQDHGTAVAETVHDMAPGASLYLAQFSDEVDFANAAAWMVSQGVDVINMSAGWSGFNPGDGTGVVNDIVTDTVDEGIFWANSAGNNRERHWMGDFTDPGGDDFLDWATGVEIQEFNALAGQPVEGILCWDDDWSAATQDYDLGLIYWNGASWVDVAWSDSVQNGTPGQQPIEGLSGTLSQDGLYGWVVARYSATRTDVSFDFFDTWRNLESPVYARSICTPADNASDGFMAVGALGRSSSFNQESYSSEGPTRDDRLAPEIAGPANTSNSVYELFAGTSASSPHVAGAAALILDANPTYTPAQLEAHLEGDAIDLGDAGPDTQTGYGRLWVDVEFTPPENQAPVAGDDEYSTDMNDDLVVTAPGVLSNDSDPDDDSITAIKVSDPSHGAVTLNSNGSFTYEPDTGYSGGDSFTYKANDGELDSGVATVDITVNSTGEPEISVSESVDFGAIEVGESLTKVITVGNTGSAPLYISKIDMLGWDTVEYELINDGVSGQTIAPGATRQLSVRFTPAHAYTGAPSFTRASGGYMARYLYDGASLTAIEMNTYPGNTGGSGNCSYSVVADGRVVNANAYVYSGDRYVLSTRIPLHASYSSFLYTSSLPGGFADSINFVNYTCDGNPSPSLIRVEDAYLEFYGVDTAPEAYLARTSLYGVGAPEGEAPPQTTYVPVAGTSRYDTAIKTSQEAFADGTADCVVIATGANWPDALGGAALAAAKNGPILLTYPTTLYAGISGEIDRLGATEAVILGGTGAVSLDVENALRTKLGYSNVTRIGGSSRYQTAELIAAAAVAELNSAGGYDGTAFVATGANFPDALAASPLAAASGWPIFLSAPTGTPPIGAMQGLGVTDALILGGTGVVSPTQESALQSAFPGHVTRLWGTDRYATGVAIATYGVDHAGLGWDGMAIATGQNFPDALAGGVLTGRNGSVMLLTASTWLPNPVAETLTINRDTISRVYYLGGTSAVSQSVRDTITGLLR